MRRGPRLGTPECGSSRGKQNERMLADIPGWALATGGRGRGLSKGVLGGARHCRVRHDGSSCYRSCRTEGQNTLKLWPVLPERTHDDAVSSENEPYFVSPCSSVTRLPKRSHSVMFNAVVQ